MTEQITQRFERGRLLSELSTFGIGGPASWFIEVSTSHDLQQVLRYCHRHQLPYFVLGRGSNVLFHDKGFKGLVIANRIALCSFEGTRVHVGAGYSFSLLGSQTARHQLSGLEFASGIPGSVGGAIYMNAGANGSDVSQVLTQVTYMTEEGEIELLQHKEELGFAYRTSIFQKRKGAIVEATFSLVFSEQAREKQIKLIEYRMRTQPYQLPSAGCVFRNPEKGSAGALIERCGLKGKSVGGAEVSTVHANFIVNKGGATSEQVLELVAWVRQSVLEKTGIELQPEVRCIPYEAASDV